MRLRRVLTYSGLAVAGVLLAPATTAVAHPLGNFTVNASAALTLTPGAVRIDYAVDLAEIPTFQEATEIDLDGDGEAEEAELEAWAPVRATEILEGLSLEVDGRAIALEPGGAGAEMSPGQGGLEVLRLEAAFVASVPLSGSARLTDLNDRGRLGWREITATGADGVAVTASSVPVSSPSDRLRSYPSDLLSSPPTTREARFTFGPGQQAPSGGVAGGSTGRPESADSPLGSLVSRDSLSLSVVLFGLFLALGVGALHALAPGHGKTVTAAYLAGANARPRDAVGAGVVVAAMHTSTVLLIGVALTFASSAFPADRVYPWLGLVAGGASVLLGASQLVQRLGHSHPQGEHRDHAHASPISKRGVAALALSGGLLPSPTAVLVLVASFTLGRAAFGLALVAAFGIGLAGALTAVGMIAIRARHMMERRLSARFVRAMPVAGAGAIATMGVLVAGRAFAQL